MPKTLRLRGSDLRGPLPDGTVILVQDWFTALFDAQVQRDVIAGFRALGYHPRLLPMRPAGKAAHAAGDLAGFARRGARLADLLHRAAGTGAPLIAFEPAFGMMLRQEYPRAGIALPPVQMAQEFLADQAQHRDFPQAVRPFPARLLAHCTETTAQPQTAAQWARVFRAIGADIDSPPTGCCGMAGLFGHQARHQQVSQRLFDMSWRAQLNGDQTVMATGFSCRCQSQRLAGQRLRHPLGIIADMLGVDQSSSRKK